MAYFELRRNLRSFRFLVSSGLLGLLVASAVWVGLADYRLRLETYEEKLQEQATSFVLGQGQVYSSLQPIVSKVPNPLAIFERGVDGQEGTEVRITIVEVPERAAGRNRGNPYLARLVGFDVTTVVKLVLGLGALLLTFDALVGVRSQSRVASLLAHGADPSAVLIGKALAVLGALVVSLTVALGPPVLFLLATGVLPLEAQLLSRLAGLMLAYLAYGATMALIGFGISLRAESVPRSLVYATLAWLVLVILMPLGLTAGITAYADSRIDVHAQLQEEERLRQERIAELRRLRFADPLRTTPSGHIALSFTVGENEAFLHRFGSPAFNESMMTYYRDRIRLSRIYAERTNAVRQKADREARSWLRPLGWMAAILPGQLLDLMSSTMAGTSEVDHARFIESAQMYRQEFLAYLTTIGAFDSWRWFTDDPSGGSPWTSFIGARPEDVTEDNIGEALDRWNAPEVQERIDALARDRKANQKLDISDLPKFQHRPSDGFQRRAMVACASLIMIGVLWLLVSDAAARSRVLYPDRVDHGRLRSTSPPQRTLQRLRSGFWGLRPAWDRSILRAELLGLIRQFRWRASAILVVVMMMAGASVFAARYETSIQDLRDASSIYESRLDGRNLAGLLDIAHLVQRPPWRLGFLIDGEERTKPSTYKLLLATFASPQLVAAPLDSQRLSSVPSPDWSFVLRVVLSLATFFLGYDALCGRRLRRCQAQVVSGASVTRVAMAKGGALWIALALPFSFGIIAGLAVLRLHGFVLSASQEMLKLAAFWVVGFWALAFYVLITLIVSAWVGVAEKALVTLILLWISAVSVIPSAAGIMVMGLEPLPAPWKIDAKLQAIRAAAEAQEGSGNFRLPHVAKTDNYTVERKAAQIHRTRRSEESRTSRYYVDRQIAQAELAERVAYLSPVSLLQDGLQGLLGSGVERQQDFIAQAYRFEETLSTWVRERDAEDPESSHLHFFSRYFSRSAVDLAELPRFRFQEPTLKQGLLRSALPWVLFALLTLMPAAFLPWIFEYRLGNEKR